MRAAPTSAQREQNTALANQIASVQDGRLDASKLLYAIDQGGNRNRLLKEAVARILELRDLVRMNAFLRAMQKGRQVSAAYLRTAPMTTDTQVAVGAITAQNVVEGVKSGAVTVDHAWLRFCELASAHSPKSAACMAYVLQLAKLAGK